MRTPRLFSDQPLLVGTEVVLEGSAAQYLGKVLRARVGDTVILFDGQGQQGTATIKAIAKHSVSAQLDTITTPQTESSLQTHLGLCLSKGDRFDWAIQKATELGVGSISPLYSTRVDFTVPPERLAKRLSHWQHIVTSACEQSGRVRIPTVNAPTSLTHWVSETLADVKLVLHCDVHGTSPLAAKPQSVALLIGPEGGLTDEEVATAERHHFQPWQLGPRILRTETAPVVALSVIGAQWGDMAQ
ncbi:MAG: 16S rRNA (uracil(1498)-N(3))-methyltransferase [Halieaceae bacterium]|nr:MAG: 16S rRNA (uracil(1498)-N(3))-methyltransferase [Halieaceae bacterium]